MSQIVVGDKLEKFLDVDDKFYRQISYCIGKSLDPKKDNIVITKPPWSSRSAAAHMLLCIVKENRYVALKRCVDNPEYIRREFAIAVAKTQFGFPSYNVIKIDGLILQHPTTGANCDLLKGWEHQTILLIDFGDFNKVKNLTDDPDRGLKLSDMIDINKFCFVYGQWMAFNYLLGIRDRNSGNFVFFTDKQELHSVDNEEGPLDSNGNDIGGDDIIQSSKQNIQKFINDNNSSTCMSSLRLGFVDGWNKIKNFQEFLIMFNPKEIERTKRLLEQNAIVLAKEIFQ